MHGRPIRCPAAAKSLRPGIPYSMHKLAMSTRSPCANTGTHPFTALTCARMPPGQAEPRQSQYQQADKEEDGDRPQALKNGNEN